LKFDEVKASPDMCDAGCSRIELPSETISLATMVLVRDFGLFLIKISMVSLLESESVSSEEDEDDDEDMLTV
jgi:hypothetical protein